MLSLGQRVLVAQEGKEMLRFLLFLAADSLSPHERKGQFDRLQLENLEVKVTGVG